MDRDRDREIDTQTGRRTSGNQRETQRREKLRVIIKMQRHGNNADKLMKMRNGE
jgi:septum formation topological specificity factor MinE